METRKILVIAGSDSSGGAGLEADQKVIAAYGCYATTATTALTAQNTQGVRDIHVAPSNFVRKQIDAVMEDVGTDVIKLGLWLAAYLTAGMLASSETAQAVAESLQRWRGSHKSCVVDPVMVATSGAQLLPKDAIKILRQDILPLTTLLTPNIPEARLLLEDAGIAVPTVDDVEGLTKLARAVLDLGPQHVLLKGGHAPVDEALRVTDDKAKKAYVVDVLAGPDGVHVLKSPFVDSENTHGTGCTLASALACNLAQGLSMIESAKAATQYVGAGILTAPRIGRGSGPINHFHSSYKLSFAPGHFVDYLLNRPDVKDCWRAHTHHAFTLGMGDGTLPLDNFKYYLVQDYLYLVHFARANALAAYKVQSIDDIAASAAIVTHIHREMRLHLRYCAEFGLSKEQVESAEESQACTAYTRYVIDIGHAEDWFALQICLMPCLLGYGEIARRLFDDPKTLREGNKYFAWIENYVAEDYSQAVVAGRAMLEKYAAQQSPARIEALVKIFVHATNVGALRMLMMKMETGFWDMGAGGGSV